MPYRLVKDYVSRDLILCLEQLHGAGLRGDIKGIAFAAILPRQRYITNVAGLCASNPTFTRGMIRCLDDELSGIINGMDVNNTR